MGAKGIRRREKNFKAAHGGGHTLLPPPPDPSSIDALPNKLRKLISITSSLSSLPGSRKGLGVLKQNKNGGNIATEKKTVQNDDFPFKSSGIEEDGHDVQVEVNDGENAEIGNNCTQEKKKRKKRKRKQINDLRFEEAKETLGIGSKRKERKKKHLQEMKKKKKNPKTEKNIEFPAHEIIKFGDVVQAPPKLPALPKGLKVTQDASKERLRLKAVEDYRKRKGWASRPGTHLPPFATSPSV